MESGSLAFQWRERQAWTISRLGKISNVLPRSSPSKAVKLPPMRPLIFAGAPVMAEWRLRIEEAVEQFRG